MHLIGRKELNSAEMDTLTKSFSPTIVTTANGEVQTHGEATVSVKDNESLRGYASSSIPGKLCDEHGYS